MRTSVVIVIALIMSGVAFPDAKELFPLDKLKINMTVEQLKEAYPDAKVDVFKKDDKGLVLEAMALQPIADNAFWSSALIFIRSDRVFAFGYVYINLENLEDFDLAKENVPEIYQQLVEHFGKEPEKKVAASDLSALAAKGEEMPVYLWKMNGQIVTFNHSPFEGHKKGEKFACVLKVMEQDSLATAFSNISDYSEDKAVLFEIPGKPETVPSKLETISSKPETTPSEPETVESYPVKSYRLVLVASTVLLIGLVLLFVAYKRTGKT